jgi:hypothetical protein
MSCGGSCGTKKTLRYAEAQFDSVQGGRANLGLERRNADDEHLAGSVRASAYAHTATPSTFMRPPSPSIPEKDFFFAALDQNARLDGREFLQARPQDLLFGSELGHVECSLGKTRLRTAALSESLPSCQKTAADVTTPPFICVCVFVACSRRWTRRWCAPSRSGRSRARSAYTASSRRWRRPSTNPAGTPHLPPHPL